MRKPTYTNLQIIEAGQQLLRELKPVSPFAIRNLLGGGNHVRIRKVWEEASQMDMETVLRLASQGDISAKHIKISLNSQHLARFNKIETDHSCSIPSSSVIQTPEDVTPVCPVEQETSIYAQYAAMLEQLETSMDLLAKSSAAIEKSRAELLAAMPEDSLYVELGEFADLLKNNLLFFK